MEHQKKEDKKHEGIKSTRSFEDDIFQISQKLITGLKNQENHARIIEDLTKIDFPQLTKKYNEEKQKNNDLTDTLKRLQAEFENYKKWNAKEKIDFVKYAHADLIAKMLPVLDSFEIALKNNNAGDKEKFLEGIKIIYAQFHSMLEAEGLRPIKSVGEKFDPYRHEVLMKEGSDKPDDAILEEFQKGYMLNDKVLRHSKVKVSGK